jgi:hypothetical protein
MKRRKRSSSTKMPKMIGNADEISKFSMVCFFFQ